jgi:hypothetical protein
MTRILLILCFLITGQVYSQREGHIWHFANYAGLDFNSGVAVPVQSKIYGVPPARNYRRSNSTLSSKDGTLLFYENNVHPFQDSLFDEGIGIFDANDSIVKSSSADPLNMYYLGPIHGTHFLPFRGSHKIAYVFVDVWNGSTLKYIWLSDSLRNGNGGLVNDSLHVLSQDSITPSSSAGSVIACVRHANGRDWWVVGHENNSDTFIIAIFTPDSCYIKSKQQIGTYQGLFLTGPTGVSSINSLRFNSKGDQLIRGNGEGLIELYSFDRCTGVLSNVRTIRPHNPLSQHPNVAFMYDIAFSPSGRFVYAPLIGSVNPQTSWSSLLQYDLLESDTSLIMKEIARMQSPQGASVGSFYNISLGLDNKLYVLTYGGYDVCRDSSYLAVIQDPDQKAPACNFQFNGLYMNGMNVPFPGLPHHPDYTIGPIDGSPCDTLGLDEYPPIVYSRQEINPEPLYVVYPNPAKGYLIISGQSLENIQRIQIYSVQGKLMLSAEPEWLSASQQRVHLPSLETGVYFLEVDYGAGVYRQKVWVE